MIRFAHAEYLMLLWVLPVLFLLAWLEHSWRIKAMRRWAEQRMWDVVLTDRAPGRILIKRWLGILAVGFIILGLTGPQVGTREVEMKREGTDIVFAFDVSQSMNAEDISPSRLIKARHEVSRLLKRLRGDRVALVPFAQVAFVQVPLTLDYSAVMTTLEALDPGILPYPGTSLSAAIEQSRKAFRADSRAQKILVLITDSEDHETDPVKQAEEAAKEGIKIFTIGMATPAGAPIPVMDSQGRTTGYKEYKKTTVVSRLNEGLLKKIAETTGGQYFRATKSGREFEQIYKVISGMDKEEFEAKQFTDYEDRFQWPIAAAFVLLILEAVIPAGRRRKA